PAPAVLYTLSLHDALPICAKFCEWLSGAAQAEYQSSIRAAENVSRSLKILLVRGTDHEVGNPIAIKIQTSCDSVTKGRYFVRVRSEEHTSELQSRFDLVCR